MYENYYYYHFKSGKIVKSSHYLLSISLAEMEAQYGELLYSEYC